jgi:hypothetical protein
MKRAEQCLVCTKALDEALVQLDQENDHRMFCSLECLVSYAVGQIRKRLEARNSQVRLFARVQRKLRRRRHSNRSRSTVA